MRTIVSLRQGRISFPPPETSVFDRREASLPFSAKNIFSQESKNSLQEEVEWPEQGVVAKRQHLCTDKGALAQWGQSCVQRNFFLCLWPTYVSVSCCLRYISWITQKWVGSPWEFLPSSPDILKLSCEYYKKSCLCLYFLDNSWWSLRW